MLYYCSILFTIIKGGLIIIDSTIIADGIRFNRITDKRLKNNTISVHIYTYIGDDNRADYSAVSYMLADSCKKYPNYIAMSKRCADLYGCTISDFMDFMGDCRMTNLSFSTIDSRFAINGEDLEKELAELALECILSPRAENGAFDADITETAKRSLYDDAIGEINDRRSYARRQGARIAYRGENISTAIEGDADDILRITPESAYTAYQNMLKHGYIDIWAFGCSDFTNSLEVFKDALTKLERGEHCKPRIRVSALKPEPEYAAEEIAMQQAIVRMYFKAPESNDRFASAILSGILGGTATSRFFTKIREKQSLCYYCSSATNRHLRTMIVNAGVNKENISRLQEAVLAEFRDICENGVTEEELEKAKLDNIERLRTMFDDPRYMVAAYCNEVLDEQFYTPEQTIEEYSKVTAERVQAVCRLYHLDSCFTLVPQGGNDD